MTTFNVISYADKNFNPHTVERLIDKQWDENFAIGDYVTNGTKMKGKIIRFELSNDLQSLFVYTDWSNVGMNLESVYKIEQLPAQHQIGDKVNFSITQSFGESPYPFTAEVKAVHFYAGKVKYDLEIPIAEEAPTRIYNIDSCFVLPKN